LIQTSLPHATPEQTDNLVDDDEYETMPEEDGTSSPPQLAISSQPEAMGSLEMLAASSQEMQATTSQMATLKSNFHFSLFMYSFI